jgi:hypothetical protein
MRTAAICPTCAVYENALCIIYNGTYLSNINVAPLEDLSTILGKINTNLVPLSGTTAPSSSATYLGQLYLNTTKSMLYLAKSVGTGATDWSLVLTAPTPTPQYANNSAALFAGLVAGQTYRTGDFLKIVH